VAGRRDRQRRPARRTATRTPKRRILVVCEGEVTEPGYVKGFERWCRNALVQVEIPNRHGVPRTLVEAAKERKQAAEETARREGDDFLLYDEVWCVLDVDDHPKLDEAKIMARDNGIDVAISNPSFELWLLLHFRDNPGAQDRHHLQKMTKGFVDGYDKHINFDRFAPHYEAARSRAARMQRQAEEDGEPHRNPTTGVFRLTESIARKDDDLGGGSRGG
jgi:hypothetical protein